MAVLTLLRTRTNVSFLTTVTVAPCGYPHSTCRHHKRHKTVYSRDGTRSILITSAKMSGPVFEKYYNVPIVRGDEQAAATRRAHAQRQYGEIERHSRWQAAAEHDLFVRLHRFEKGLRISGRFFRLGYFAT